MPSIAIIGTQIGGTLHAPALKAAGFNITTLVGRDKEKTEQRAAYLGIPQALTSAEQAIESDVDAVVVASPPDTHYPLAMAALKAGKHILCEKPLALTAAQAREMRDAARQANVATVLQLQLRWAPTNMLTRDIISSGDLGDPIHMTANYDNPIIQRPGPPDMPDWWQTAETGGGWLRNLNAHGIDLIRYFFGDFAAVSGVLHNDPGRGMTADDAYAIAFVLKSGMQGAMTGSGRSWDMQNEVRLHFTRGLISLNAHEPTSIGLTDEEGSRRVEPPADTLADFKPVVERSAPAGRLPGTEDSDYAEAHEGDFFFLEQVALCTAFARKINDPAYRHPSLADFADGVAALEVIEAVEESARTRRWVDLPG